MRRVDSTIPGLSELVDWREMRRRWPLIALAGIASGLLAVAYVLVCEPVFEAQTRVVIQNVGLDLGEINGSAYDKEFLSTQAEIIGSPATINRSLAELPPASTSSGADPVAEVSEHLRVSPLANTDIVRVTYQHSDPEHAVERLASIIDSYRLHLQEAEQTSTSQSVDLLASRASELEGQMSELQQQLRAIRSSAAFSTGFETEGAASPIMEELLVRWANVQSQLAGIDASLAPEAGPALATSIVEVNPDWSRELTQLQSDLTLAKVQAEELAGVYGPSHPERQTAEQRLASLQSQYETREAEVRSNLTAQRSRLEHERTVLDGLLAEEQSRMITASDDRLSEQQLQSDLTRLTEQHTSIVQTLETLRLADRTIAGGRGSIRIEILDEFVVPTDPVWPKPVPLIAIATIVGMLLGMAVVVLMHVRHVGIASGGDEAPSAATSSSESELLASARSLQSDVHAAVSGNSGSNMPAGKLTR